MQKYQKGKLYVNSWDDAEPVTIQTHPSLNIVQVEPQYVTNINPEPHDNSTISISPPLIMGATGYKSDPETPWYVQPKTSISHLWWW